MDKDVFDDISGIYGPVVLLLHGGLTRGYKDYVVITSICSSFCFSDQRGTIAVKLAPVRCSPDR